MTEQPNTGAGLRGAVDLSGLQGTAGAGASAGMPGGAGGASAAGGAGGATGVPGRSGAVVEGTDANFQEIANASLKVPLVAVLWAAQLPESRDYLDTVVKVAVGSEGRFQVVSINVEANPGLMRAFQVQSVPVTIGLVQGQPVPMFAGVQPEQTVKQVLDEFLAIAVQQGVVDRVQLGDGDGAGEDEEKPLPPLHQEAFDAIENGDLDAAARAYKTALKQDPNDNDAEIGLAQVGLMQRTQGVDLQAAREKAAAAPLDVDAQIMVADLDLLGGHVEDAFTRLIDLVRATGGEERERARAHLLELFAVVGNADERVRKGRTALMSALF
jgi:putative thioredoxin